jgi:hypothetical protein
VNDILRTVNSGLHPTVLVVIVVAIALLLFAIWLVWMGRTQGRAGAQSGLSLVGVPLAEGQSGDRWFVHNNGSETLPHLRIEAVVPGHANVASRTYVGELSNPLPGGASLPLKSIGLSWAGPTNVYRDHPTKRVWEGATAKALWTDASGRERTEQISVLLSGGTLS